MLEFNLNYNVYVQLNDKGREILRATGMNLPTDAEGWTKIQLWELMREFGPHLHIGLGVPFSTVIRLEKVSGAASPSTPPSGDESTGTEHKK